MMGLVTLGEKKKKKTTHQKVRRQLSASQEEGPYKHKISQHLDFGLPDFRTVRNMCLI